MLPFKRTFDSDKQQLQQLNGRLVQYLSRTKQLEQENALLIAEINKLRQVRTAERQPKYKEEMRELRRMLGQLSFEKSQAEMEKEKLWRELQMVQSLCSEQTEVCRDISGELKGRGVELHQAHKTNSDLQQRLAQLEIEYKRLEDAHRQQMVRLQRQVDSRVVPILTQPYRGPPAASVEEVQECARGLSDGWMETFEMYQHKVDEMEQSIRADQAKLTDMQREKMLYVSELDKLHREAEKQGQVQLRLEEQLMNMQEKFRVDFSEYQMIIEQLEHERNMMANTMEEKMKEHQHLLQVKMDLGMEVASYRALLEGERLSPHRRVNQHQRERVIDIKVPAQAYSQRASTLTTRQQTRYTPPTSNLRRSPMHPSGSLSPSRVIPISVLGRERHQSPASRRDMISFNKARASAAAPMSTTVSVSKDKQSGTSESLLNQNVQKVRADERTVTIKQVSQLENEGSPTKSSITVTKSKRVVSPPTTSISRKTEAESKKQVSDEKEKDNVDRDEFKNKGYVIGPSERKMLDSVTVEEIIEKVMKPAGLEAKVCSSGDSKVKYHVEKTEQEDGTTKTQIVLESKVEEELDFSEDSTLEELLSQGVKKVSLKDIEDTTTGSMIKNLLSGLQGSGDLQNKSVNVEIIEEPVESYSDEELEAELKSRSTFYEPTSTYFQIEELENVPQSVQFQRSEGDTMKTSKTDTDHWKGGSVQVQEVSKESEYFSHGREPDEYFVSTPDENLSESEEGVGITSYGHYGIVDDLSDERYYQDEDVPPKRVIVEQSDKHKLKSGEDSFIKDSFPECIIEEEVRVSPIVQESMLEFLREESLEPKEQLKGALEKLQSSVSGPLREELAFLTKYSSESPQNVAIKKVQQSTDNGTVTIVAELNVSQTLEDSGLLDEGDDLSDEQIMATLRSSNLGLEKVLQGGAGAGYSFRVSKEEDVKYEDDFEFEGESASQSTEEHFELGPSEKSFPFQMDVQGSHAETTSKQGLQSDIIETPVKVSQEKRVATLYLESPTDD
ncbi:synemin [Labrus mixtus]|uniref:synemin n=1 Tax=Labrus mixtus TaxID=508554 RepID=UPI0029C0394D|nr:synemin [Labrus mixtus]